MSGKKTGVYDASLDVGETGVIPVYPDNGDMLFLQTVMVSTDTASKVTLQDSETGSSVAVVHLGATGGFVLPTSQRGLPLSEDAHLEIVPDTSGNFSVTVEAESRRVKENTPSLAIGI